ncbi:hypothetical protein [Nocardioides sp. Leaf374]|uniref:hypothetical protein n=1 Tax=Nocardioides sp. Leaf374 TaxID=2876560 RepID=UPI001E30EF55|nr:hypothetical protein [Nocardioides sp. Leaf374]
MIPALVIVLAIAAMLLIHVLFLAAQNRALVVERDSALEQRDAARSALAVWESMTPEQLRTEATRRHLALASQRAYEALRAALTRATPGRVIP